MTEQSNEEYTLSLFKKHTDFYVEKDQILLAEPVDKPEKLLFNPKYVKYDQYSYYVWSGSNFVDLYSFLRKSNITPLLFNPTAKTTFIRKIPEAIAPSKSRASDSGFDLHLVKFLRRENEVDYYTTGLIVIPPAKIWYELVPRSSMGKTGLMLANTVGIIDSGYRGEIIVGLRKIPTVEDIARVVFITASGTYMFHGYDQEFERLKEKPYPLQLPAKLVQLIPREWIDTEMEEMDEEQAKSYGMIGTSRADTGGFGSKQFTHTDQVNQPQ